MIALTVVIHIAGIIGLIAYLKTHGARIVGHRNYIVMTRVLVVTGLGIFCVRPAEIWTWAAVDLARWV